MASSEPAPIPEASIGQMPLRVRRRMTLWYSKRFFTGFELNNGLEPPQVARGAPKLIVVPRLKLSEAILERVQFEDEQVIEGGILEVKGVGNIASSTDGHSIPTPSPPEQATTKDPAKWDIEIRLDHEIEQDLIGILDSAIAVDRKFTKFKPLRPAATDYVEKTLELLLKQNHDTLKGTYDPSLPRALKATQIFLAQSVRAESLFTRSLQVQQKAYRRFMANITNAFVESCFFAFDLWNKGKIFAKGFSEAALKSAAKETTETAAKKAAKTTVDLFDKRLKVLGDELATSNPATKVLQDQVEAVKNIFPISHREALENSIKDSPYRPISDLLEKDALARKWWMDIDKIKKSLEIALSNKAAKEKEQELLKRFSENVTKAETEGAGNALERIGTELSKLSEAGQALEGNLKNAVEKAAKGLPALTRNLDEITAELTTLRKTRSLARKYHRITDVEQIAHKGPEIREGFLNFEMAMREFAGNQGIPVDTHLGKISLQFVEYAKNIEKTHVETLARMADGAAAIGTSEWVEYWTNPLMSGAGSMISDVYKSAVIDIHDSVEEGLRDQAHPPPNPPGGIFSEMTGSLTKAISGLWGFFTANLVSLAGASILIFFAYFPVFTFVLALFAAAVALMAQASSYFIDLCVKAMTAKSIKEGGTSYLYSEQQVAYAKSQLNTKAGLDEEFFTNFPADIAADLEDLKLENISKNQGTSPQAFLAEKEAKFEKSGIEFVNRQWLLGAAAMHHLCTESLSFSNLSGTPIDPSTLDNYKPGGEAETQQKVIRDMTQEMEQAFEMIDEGSELSKIPKSAINTWNHVYNNFHPQIEKHGGWGGLSWQHWDHTIDWLVWVFVWGIRAVGLLLVIISAFYTFGAGLAVSATTYPLGFVKAADVGEWLGAVIRLGISGLGAYPAALQLQRDVLISQMETYNHLIESKGLN